MLRALVFFLITFQLVDGSGFVRFTLREFQLDKAQGDAICCVTSHSEKECHCQIYVHVCVGVGFEHRKYHRDCSLLHHNSRVISSTNLLSNYNVSIPFDVRWPVKNVSLLVEMRHEPNKAIIFRSENFLQLSPLSDDMLRITEEKGNMKIEYDIKVQCGEHFYGPECAIFCNPSIGSFHFKCSSDGQRLCEDGWSGQNCDDPICANGCVNGYCVSPGTCRCRNGWQGDSCDRCKTQEGCKHGFCNKANECICEKNWGGTYCDRDLDYCFHNAPCLNGGKCSSGGLQNFYYCNCTSGFTGQNCEIKLDPCINVDCGKYGRCLESSDSVNRYVCQCDPSHHGDHCQYPLKQSTEGSDHLHPITQPGNCQLSDLDYMPTGFSWTTVDCRHCVCQKGGITCSEKRCEPRDCYRNETNLAKPANCPKDQHCVIVTEDECLREKCDYPRGRCLSWPQINSEMARRICRERLAAGSANMQGCARIQLEFDLESLLPGTVAGDICFHLLLDANTANITHIGFDCKRTAPNTVQVDIISLQFLSDVTMAKEFLKNRLRNRLTASQALAAVTRIVDSDDNVAWNTKLLKKIAITPTKESTSFTTRQMLVVIICLMLLIILILLNICILKNPYLCTRKRFFGSSRSKEDLLELRLRPAGPTRIYTTQALIKPEKRKSSLTTTPDIMLQSVRNDEPFLCEMNRHYSVAESVDSGINDRELHENERNSRILEHQLKSKLRILDGSPPDDSRPILSPVSLHLTDVSTQLLGSRTPYHH